jgi:tight adherence protein C
MTAWVVGAAWGALLATPLLLRARRQRVAARAALLRVEPARAVSVPTTGRSVFGRVPTGVVGRVARGWMARRRAGADDAVLGAELPVTLDLLGVAVGAGCTPYLAVEVASRWAPPRIAARLTAVVRACTLGASLGQALDELAAATPRLHPLTDALMASDRLGAPVGPALARLAGEERAALRRRAETNARTVPVRLLFPLVFLVLPAFGLLTLAPALLSGVAQR